jgi:hypothetical protein
MDPIKLVIPIVIATILIACGLAIHHRKNNPLPEKPEEDSDAE